MVSLARASLIYDWRRYAAAVFAITFAGLLVIVQLALLLGLFGTVSVAVDQSNADIWLGYPKTQSVDLGRTIANSSSLRAWMQPNVQKLERFTFVAGDLRRADGVALSVFVYGIDTRPDGSAFAHKLTARQRQLLEQPYAMIIDAADQEKLAAEIGVNLEINGKRAQVVDVVSGIRGIGAISLITSLSNLGRIAPDMSEATTFYLLAVDKQADIRQVVADIQDTSTHKRYEVWTAADLSAQSQIYWLLESGVGIGTGFASLLALLVGIVITSQTLNAAILASLKEFAALRALGISNASLRNVVFEQSFWLGLIGLSLTFVFTAGIAWLGDTYYIEMRFPWWLLLSVAVLILAIALGSGLIALRPLFKADPANLLR